MCVNRCCSFSGDRTAIRKEAKNILKYKDLTIEIQCMWNINAKIIPLKTGATGTVSKSFRQDLNIIPGKHEIKKVHKKQYGALHTYFRKF
jgi:hypothetical protein